MSIHFTKFRKHFAEDDVIHICIDTDAITLDDLNKAYNDFLRACGYQVVEEGDECPSPKYAYEKEEFDAPL